MFDLSPENLYFPNSRTLTKNYKRATGKKKIKGEKKTLF